MTHNLNYHRRDIHRPGYRLHPATLTVLYLIAAVLCFQPVSAQQVILNTRGERIVVYPDGSWRYYETADSAILNKHLLKRDIPVDDENTVPAIEKTSLNPAADADISSLSVRFAERLSAETASVRQNLTEAVADKFELEGRLDQAQANKKLIEPDFIAALEDAFELSRLEVKKTSKHLKTLEKFALKAQDMLALRVERKPKALNKLIARYESYMLKEEPLGGHKIASTPAVRTLKPEKSGRKPERVKAVAEVAPRLAKADRAPVNYQRAPVPCRLQRGDASMRNGLAVEKGILFTHTDEDLRPYFRQQELVTCYASLHQIENNTYLSLEFQISSSDARRNFGVLESMSLLRLKLISGLFVSLSNARTDPGRLDAYTGNTIYTGNYLLDKQSEKLLSRYTLDKIRVLWSSGFEDYDIVDVDFLINQFNCLRSGAN